MEPFKNVYNPDSVTSLAHHIKLNYPQFKSKDFLKTIIKEIHTLELKERVNLITNTLESYLPKDYDVAVKVLINSLAPINDDSKIDSNQANGITGFLVWPLTNYISAFGLDHFETSMHALEELTKRFTAEFAIRFFINHNTSASYKYLNKWSKSKNFHLRRLSSEGCRPNLPWGIKLQNTEKILSFNIKILNRLQNDPELYVRKSVANHLNDISRIDEKLFFNTVNSFNSHHSNTQWIIRHASRSLLKKGHPKALKLHDYKKIDPTKINLKLSDKEVEIGSSIKLKVVLKFDPKDKQKKILIDYILGFNKNNGKISEMAFRLKDTIIPDNCILTIEKDISFKPVTTRKLYPGNHTVKIQVNGKKSLENKFKLLQ